MALKRVTDTAIGLASDIVSADPARFPDFTDLPAAASYVQSFGLIASRAAELGVHVENSVQNQRAPAATKTLAHPDDPACAVAFRKQMSAELVTRGRTDFFKMHESRSGTERHLELVYARLATARDLIGKKATTDAGTSHDVTAQVTDRSSERAHAIFHDDTLGLEVAGHDWMKELVRRVFGETYFGSGAHFEGSETVSLTPLLDLAAALSAEGIPGLKKVELQELWVDLDGQGGWVGTGARGDCSIGAPAFYVARGLTDGAPAEATFHLRLVGRTRPFKLKLCPPRLVFDRSDLRIVRIVRDWVVARGFVSMQNHVRESLGADGSAPETDTGAE